MVAIILVNFNGADDTIECIKSLDKIEANDYEIIVVDNCSTDDSLARLEQQKDEFSFTLLKANSNLGFSAGNNIGIRYAMENHADYYLLLNNDTVVEPDFLTKLLDGFGCDETCGITTSKIRLFSCKDVLWYDGGSMSRKTARTEHWNYGEKDNNTSKELEHVTFVSGCCMCISNAVIDKVGMMNEDFFLYEEDAEYCRRVIDAEFTMIYVPDSVIYHKVSASTGKGSPMSQYYTVRNKYILIKENYKSLNKLTAYAYNTLQMLFRCIKKEMSFKWYSKGMRAFLRNEKGKVEV